MKILIYNFLTQAYFFGIKLTGLWNDKARLWAQGRVGVFDKIEREISAKRVDNQRLVWMHCASLGEFEQGRTVMEALKKAHPAVLLLLTFFSPSGYEIRKNYPQADWVFYLPPDSKSNAQRFLSLVKPDLAIFVKYEFWYYYLQGLAERTIPTLLVSAIFRPSHPFFKWYGGLHRKMLGFFDEILVQDEASSQLLAKLNLKNVTVAGDCRVDRVIEIAKKPKDLPLVKAFCGESPILICGSTWPADEAILNPIFADEKFKDWKFILAPHDVQPAHLQAIESSLSVFHFRFSQLESTNSSEARLLLIDNIGLLSSLYYFGKIAYIGGGFGHGIHNTLEPAAYGLPVIFGPNYQKFEEAVWLVGNGGGFVVKDGIELRQELLQLTDFGKLVLASNTAKSYVQQKAGGTQVVVNIVYSLLLP
ncbi:MAG: 3-deoxy-D-manno-octulosonic acid transferase [Saprospiraceae bacterium]|nr:3-deoxy-D-manno-octulosonic acid transferase [Saprospiraceae bacterium]MCF8251417.1 3-deoxy-D-manno-octulosonic acid transferase [Saprospiraceae bacterium]MCF8312691.1 3-deoxy-D-manno-octulosonic acid transferase [Saprospiraceae bacterium]MCF8441043.1 3-deoxy-D-manno-octulosonic acid transferase [Saprospiraceae bacterium]